MSQFISLNILASIVLGAPKKTSSPETSGAASASEPHAESNPAQTEEPSSASRISVNRIRVEG